ncbi:hypothetical protein DVK00_02935 [Haloarcula sp. Atlit-47R]|uniref:recombinase family protein n=1 Tax=Haloarcula sp. Atlit-47R TaxID=2282132 RepID=UPI000EF202ED|nr:recombinase family protein [Haloarcula sp. Atlit-47R]RLM47479.1 hypothetical protein DVK00_02935 [Haloarcula sp. Atlit-47R]
MYYLKKRMSEEQPKRAWGYVRLSQDGREGTLTEQKNSISTYAREREDLSLITTLNEGKRTSGFTSDRAKYQTLLEKIENNELDAIIVRDRARLARDFDLRLQLLLLLRASGVEMHVTEEGGPARLHQVQNAIFDVMKAGMGHIAKMRERERAQAAVTERLDSGGWQGGIPYGFRLDSSNQYLVPDEDEFEDLEEVLRHHENGVSGRSIAERVGITHGKVRSIISNTERVRAAQSGALIGNGGPVWPDE